MKLWAKQKQNGFTIVELLIVIVVIAILAAISIVAYNGIQNRANDTIIKSDLANIAKKLELAKIDLGHYPEKISEMPEYKVSKAAYDPARNNAYLCVDRLNLKFAYGAQSRSGKGFIQTNSGLLEGVSVSGAATCDAIGKTWANNATTATFQGYSATGYEATNGWYSAWSWTK